MGRRPIRSGPSVASAARSVFHASPVSRDGVVSPQEPGLHIEPPGGRRRPVAVALPGRALPRLRRQWMAPAGQF